MNTVKQTDVRHPYLRGRRKRSDDVMMKVESGMTARFLTWTALERMHWKGLWKGVKLVRDILILRCS